MTSDGATSAAIRREKNREFQGEEGRSEREKTSSDSKKYEKMEISKDENGQSCDELGSSLGDHNTWPCRDPNVMKTVAS